MEYLVLARKWRPQIFDDVVGQDHVVRTLKNAIRLGRTAHAYLFSGPRGTGKTSVARILAKALNCETGPVEVPCNQCVNCREITDGSSLDVHEIDGASNRGIDEIRELRENIKFAPASSRYKIYIIDEVHMLTKEAFNALLKTLEEPPPHVIFMFATTEIYRVPATILSRCQHFDFKRIPLKKIVDNLRYIADAEKITVSDKVLAWIAREGEGSIRDSQSIFDQVISYAGSEITDDSVEELLSLTERRFLFDLSKAVLARNAGACLKIIDDVYYTGVDMKYFYQLILNHFMNLVMVKIAAEGELLRNLPDHEVEALGSQAGEASRETLQRLLDILMAEEEDVRRSMDPRVNLEYALVKMAYLEPVIPVGEILGRMESLERRLSSGSVAAPPVTDDRRVPAPPDGPDEVPVPAAPRETPKNGADSIRLWVDFKEHLRKKNKPLWSKIEPGCLAGYDGETFRIGFPQGYIFYDTICEKPQLDRLSRLAAEFFGRPVKIDMTLMTQEEVLKNNGQSVPPPEKGKSVMEMKSEALRQPLLQDVLDTFTGAEVKDVIVKNGK
ncbi:MAG: DNA polymerase III subunit gamma/tau [Deltaproteobacteria bacterium]|nr:DNA polymerase III subunit gamma/tau [Deltaproteobacteria bacterium]